MAPSVQHVIAFTIPVAAALVLSFVWYINKQTKKRKKSSCSSSDIQQEELLNRKNMHFNSVTGSSISLPENTNPVQVITAITKAVRDLETASPILEVSSESEAEDDEKLEKQQRVSVESDKISNGYLASGKCNGMITKAEKMLSSLQIENCNNKKSTTAIDSRLEDAMCKIKLSSGEKIITDVEIKKRGKAVEYGDSAQVEYAADVSSCSNCLQSDCATALVACYPEEDNQVTTELYCTVNGKDFSNEREESSLAVRSDCSIESENTYSPNCEHFDVGVESAQSESKENIEHSSTAEVGDTEHLLGVKHEPLLLKEAAAADGTLIEEGSQAECKKNKGSTKSKKIKKRKKRQSRGGSEESVSVCDDSFSSSCSSSSSSCCNGQQSIDDTVNEGIEVLITSRKEACHSFDTSNRSPLFQMRVISEKDDERDSANHSPVEAIFDSNLNNHFCDARSEGSNDSGKGCSEGAATPTLFTPAGGSSVAGDNAEVVTFYEFEVPQDYVGKLIGRRGQFVSTIRDQTNVRVYIKKHPTDTAEKKICALEGTPTEISLALDIIRGRFPVKFYPDLTLEEFTLPLPISCPLRSEFCQLHLIEGVNNDVLISSVISAGHLFLQQPLHPLYKSLNTLNTLMNTVYCTSGAPPVTEPAVDTIVAAPAMGGWYRAQIMSVSEMMDICEVRFLDYGGYMTLNSNELRAIRMDLLNLPFQAVECFLANIVPIGGVWSEESKLIVQSLTYGFFLKAQVCDYCEGGLPLVSLYVIHGDQVVSVNEELVARGYAVYIMPTTAASAVAVGYSSGQQCSGSQQGQLSIVSEGGEPVTAAVM